MDKRLLESIKDKSREERAEFFMQHKDELLEDALFSVNTGANTNPKPGENPHTEVVPYKYYWWSSHGFICDGEFICGVEE